ncbi:hypothetical protein [Marinomonas algicola]|jgi:hypothetical protein|uniref:hypothetical protein n=1 Tax=Marinomonas algicola TaxID=2773454 RepID=UPI00174C3D29|nr:hypothetical protein [Marinomonas algicola]
MLTSITKKYRKILREKAISRAKTRIVLAGRKAEEMSEEDLEVVVQEEEQKIKSEVKEKGLLAVLALLGISLFG